MKRAAGLSTFWSLQWEVIIDSPEAGALKLSETFENLKGRKIILWQGPMGAGKTSLIRAWLKLMGFEDVSSPTYALHHRYEIGSEKNLAAQIKCRAIEHWDLFRLSTEEELESSGFWDSLQDPDLEAIFIEWPERMETKYLPLRVDCFRLEISILNGSRKISLFKRR
jgi:tRNA threonylcarbamoyladenosine biosynthesis protein TsaE